MRAPSNSALKLLSGALLLGVLAFLILLTLRGPERATAAFPCSTTSPTGTYTITLCLKSPLDGSTLSDLVSVSSTVTVNGPTPGIQKLIFRLNNQYLLTDFASPYSFTLPTKKFMDVANVPLSAQVFTNDGNQSNPVTITVSLSNGNTVTPTNTSPFTPTSGTLPASGQPFVLAAVGDGAAGQTTESDVVNLIGGWNPNLFLYLGDVLDEGSPAEFYNWYAPEIFFGRFQSITNPTIGVHEYLMTPNPSVPYAPAGYIDYWGQVPNYYSFNAGGWHMVDWNSNCIQAGGCGPNSQQYDWLAGDLQANQSIPCTLVFYHTPLFDVGPEATSFNGMSATWTLMAQNGVDIVLNGNSHDYQRWVPLDGSYNPSSSGVTQFIAGTGGHDIQTFVYTDARLAVGFDHTTVPLPYGALRLELYPNGAVFKFVNTAGTILDSGSLVCSGASGPVPPLPPPAPTPPPTPSSTYLLYLPLFAK